MTDDFGETWKPITGNLPRGSTRCLREDVTIRTCCIVERSLPSSSSLDRGKTWTKFNNNLPTVAVHEVAIHPTAGEIVVATHGRSLWILDVTALRQMASEKIKDEPTLFKPNTVTRWQHAEPRPIRPAIRRREPEARRPHLFSLPRRRRR